MQQFKINAGLDPDADVRDIEPLIVPRRLRDPLADQLRPDAGGERGIRGTVMGGLRRVLGD